jgi:arginine decarboxylase
MEMHLPTMVILTKGVGQHKEKLVSFEMALREAGIAHLNLVPVSSIKPREATVSRDPRILGDIPAGTVTPVVLSRQETKTNSLLIAASIGVAVPENSDGYGYLSEHHEVGQTKKEAGDYSEDLAAQMLATIMGLEFDMETSWDERKEVFRAGGKKNRLISTMNITASARGNRGGWSTVVAAAVLI